MNFRAAGFSDERIKWLSEAHIPGAEMAGLPAEDMEKILPLLQQIGKEDLYLFSRELTGTADIARLGLPDRIKEIMKVWMKNRTLLKTEKGGFFPSWHHARTRGYSSLNDRETALFREICDDKQESSEKIWEKRGEKLLSAIKSGSDMMVCAEDLGVVPECVPRVLSRLKIFGLRVAFWGRDYFSPGHPFIPVRKYPHLSVATLSVHDSQCVPSMVG